MELITISKRRIREKIKERKTKTHKAYNSKLFLYFVEPQVTQFG